MPEQAQYNLNYLKVLGPLRVQSVTPHDLKGERVRVCILMGPTGSGKSAFIEALVPDQGLSISGYSLESITQNVVLYRVENLQDGELPVILMDTPGLLDPRISESRVVSMISNELDMLRASVEMAVVTLCYFHPIDVARVGGTKRGAVEFLQGFAQTFKANNVNIVTTMWNMLWNEKLSTAAELRFEALKAEIYKASASGLPSLNVTLDRFKSTPASTLSVLDACRHGWYHTTRKQRISLPTYDTMVLQGLVERIQNIQQELSDLAQDDHELPVVCTAEDKACLLLYRFCCDLYDCDPRIYCAIFPDAQCPPITIDCQPSLSQLVCYRSMSPIQAQPASTVAASVDPPIPRHSPSPKPWIKSSGMPKVRDSDREGIKAVTEPSMSVVDLEPTRLVQVEDSQVLNNNPDLAAVISKLEYLTVIGDISVEPVNTGIPVNAKVYVIMGPRGSGKSSVVEALQAKSQDLQIARDQLASFTQTVVAYHVVNVLHSGCPIYLLDTPGFEDSQKSEMEIMSMIPAWMEQNGIHFFHQILFSTPITDTRMPGSRRRTVEMLKGLLTATHDLDSVLVVTTMWDMIYNDRILNRAESNFTQLASEFFKEFIDRGADITRYMNTKASALEILDRPLHKKRAFDDIGFTVTLRLYQDLHKHIENAILDKRMIEDDLSQPDAQRNPNLKAILDESLRKYGEILDKFIEQFIEYGVPPASCAAAHQRVSEHLVSVRPELLHRLPPSSLSTSDDTTLMAGGDQTNETMQAESRRVELAPQNNMQIFDRHQPDATRFSRRLHATKDWVKQLPGFKH